MKTVTAAQLVDAYDELNPGEHNHTDIPAYLARTNGQGDPAAARADVERIFNNWLERYLQEPELAICTVKTAWGGKVTAALFKALGIKQPRTKPAMLRALMEMNEIVGQYCFPTGLIYADRTRDDPRTQDYKRLAYLNYASLQLDLEPDCKGELADYVKTEAAKIQAMKGQLFSIAGNMKVILGSEAV
jgi:hypothetical protein